MEAFELAMRQQADYIELDVQLSADGEVVVAHDTTLERVSDGTGLLNARTLAELKRLDFGKSCPGCGVCRIPTLREVYDFARPTSLMLNVELKTMGLPYPELPGKLLSLAAEYSMQERILYSSFNDSSLACLREADPAVSVGLLIEQDLAESDLENLWGYIEDMKLTALHPNYLLTDVPRAMRFCRAHGVALNVWTPDEEPAIARMLGYGVNGIITNRPDVAAACRGDITAAAGSPADLS
jgi:glycerophosphoryl diester phosphodiesterase